MFALRMRYLTGRVYSAEFEEGDDKHTVEWPPHPSRLFSALVASWGEGGAEPELRAPLEWLERQEPPAIYYGDCSPRSTVEVFVPVNDNNGIKSFLGLTMKEGRKARRFPSASLAEPEVWFVWHEALPTDIARSMEALMRRTPSLGHSATLVSMETGGNIPGWLKRLEPHPDGDTRLRVLSPGRLETLVQRFEQFQKDPSKVHRPNRGKTALYSAGGKSRAPAARGLFGEMVSFRLESRESLYLPATLALTSALRGALISEGPQPPPEAISGHAPRSSPQEPLRSERPHIALAPLAFTSSRHANGQILGAAILLPSSLTGEERLAVLQSAKRVRELRMAFGVWKIAHTGEEEARSTLLPYTWMGPARAWATVTPYVFDRYPNDPYGKKAQETVRVSCERVGLPRPSSVTLMKTSVHLGVPPAIRFPATPARKEKPRRFHLHALLTFEHPVTGPVVAGAGRYYGYGLFRPIAEGSWS